MGGGRRLQVGDSLNCLLNCPPNAEGGGKKRRELMEKKRGREISLLYFCTKSRIFARKGERRKKKNMLTKEKKKKGEGKEGNKR